MPECQCVVVNREPFEEQRDWLKRCMCMHHWMQTDYYIAKLPLDVQEQLKFDWDKGRK